MRMRRQKKEKNFLLTANPAFAYGKPSVCLRQTPALLSVVRHFATLPLCHIKVVANVENGKEWRLN